MDNIHPNVAILMATFNGEDFLDKQLTSILNQTYKNFKIYISDDCSTDNSVNIIEYYKKNYPNKIELLINRATLGFIKNFESLLSHCTEEYIALSDQDDIWESDNLQIKMQEMQELEIVYERKAILVHSDLSMIDKHDAQIYNSYFAYRKYALNNEHDLGHILGPSGVMGNTLLMNKALKELVLPFDENIDTHDYWIAVQAELFGLRKTISQQLVQYRIHDKNISNSSAEIYKKSNFLKLFTRDIRLPNLETKRKLFLPLLLLKVSDTKDKIIMQAYIDYLRFKKNRFIIYFELIQYSLVKRDFVFRVKLLFKILFTNRYE